MDFPWVVLVLIATFALLFSAVALVLSRKLPRSSSAPSNACLDELLRSIESLNEAIDDIDRRFIAADARSVERARSIDASFARLEGNMTEMRKELVASLEKGRLENERQLEAMRMTVDEKLSKTLNDSLNASFESVSKQLESVYKGLGDMQSVAAGVGDLKRVLSNVKTRGILGEVQLGAILGDILTRDQYEENVITKPGSLDRVEFAVKIPKADGAYALLPIDSKFPATVYEQLRDAIESGDKLATDAARKTLESRIKNEAADIQSKYLSVPDTTNFAIMFLPFEGLYAEVVDRPGLIEELQRSYHVNIAGPSTMAAILNSLQMSYQTLALQKHAGEIQNVLAAVKSEFPKYQEALRTAKKQIERAGKTVDTIITTRTNVIERKLDSVTALEDSQEVERLLGMGVDPSLGEATIDPSDTKSE